MTKHFTEAEDSVLNAHNIETKNAIINIFELADIEDRFTEKSIITDACIAIKDLLWTIQNT